MDYLSNFLDNGSLPFVGRREQSDRALRFWRAAVKADELRAALMIGETGIGKSRLLADIIERIEALGGVAIHAKLYPETSTSIVPLVAQALWHARDLRGIVGREPNASIMETVDALRRVSRLRPTLLVIEDIHLLSGDSLHELAVLLETLADQTLAVLCAARPVELKVLGVLERYLTDEIELRGLDNESIAIMWRTIFGASPSDEVVAAVVATTAGIPFAIRSALRGAVRAGMIADAGSDEGWSCVVGVEALRHVLESGVARLSEGMAVHLDDAERTAAEHLACLGEIFARETAAALIDDSDSIIDALTTKGIVATTATAVAPLPGNVSAGAPIAFTHTLLHQHLVAPRAATDAELLRIISANLPLYSILPFQLFRPGNDDVVVADTVRGAIERTLLVAAHLDHGPAWPRAIELWNVAELLSTWHGTCFEPGERLLIEARLAIRRLALMRRDPTTAEFAELLNGVFALTENLNSSEMLMERMWAFRHLHTARTRADYANAQRVWVMVHEFIGHHPSIARTNAYFAYLRDLAQDAARAADEVMLRRIEVRLDSLLAQEDQIGPDARRMVHQVRTHLLLIFDSQEELAHRLRFLEEEPDNTSIHALPVTRLAFLESIGHMREALAICDKVLNRFAGAGLGRHALQCSLTRLCAISAFGSDLDDVASEASRLIGAMPHEDAASARRSVAINLTEIGLLRGSYDWIRRIAAEHGDAGLNFWPECRLLLAVEREAILDAAEVLPNTPQYAPLARLAETERGADGMPAPEIVADVRRLLETPLLRLDDLLILHAALALLDARDGVGGKSEMFQASARGAILRAFEWLAERGLFAFMTTLLDRFGHRLPRRELPGWRARIRALQEVHEHRRADVGDGRTHITMIGSIGYHHPNGTVQPIRGGRLRIALGLLAGMEMMRDPLSVQEFRRAAAGDEADPELARKTTNMAIARLRETIGDDAVVTSEGAPRLNMDAVQVDLLDAHRLLAEGHAALRRRAYMRAFPAALGVLDIVRNEIPLPGLFDDVFEALRSDFDAELRALTVGLARDLLRESDAASAEQLLQRACITMPDDEEVAELLETALERLGRRAEAMRLRMRTGTQYDD